LHAIIKNIYLNKFIASELVSDRLSISWRENFTFRWDDDNNVHFVL